MKKYLFIVLAAVISLFSSCAEDDAAIGLSGLKVSQSYVALPVEGGSTDITIESKSEWIITGNDKADWLTISTTQGPQGESKITFSADEAVDGRSVELKLSSANETQNLTIMQGLPVISEATCAEVIAGPDKKTYKVTGVVSNISNTVTATGTLWMPPVRFTSMELWTPKAIRRILPAWVWKKAMR